MNRRTVAPLFGALMMALLSSGIASAASLTVAWDASASTTVAGYVISYGAQSGVYTGQFDVGNQLSGQVTQLTAGATYFFAVQAYDTTGLMSLLSGEVSGIAPTTSPLAITCPVP